MKLYDVLVLTKFGKESVYRSGVTKKESKKIVEKLRNKGLKAQAVSSKNRKEDQIEIDEIEQDIES